MVRDELTNSFAKVLQNLKVPAEKLSFERPGTVEHGDYASGIALVLFSRKSELKNKELSACLTPLDLANKLVNAWRSGGLPDYVGRVEVAPPGFINVWLSGKYLVSQLEQVIKTADQYGSGQNLKGKKILLEHTSPNPQTTIMLGHLRNNFLGMCLARMFELAGARVTLDNMVNDRGVHLCRSMWGYLVFARKRDGLTKNELKNFREVKDQQVKAMSAKVNWRQLLADWSKNKTGWYVPADLKLKSDHANLVWYVLGSKSYRLSEKVKCQVGEILQAWEEDDQAVRRLWAMILAWSDEGYQKTYKRIGSKHDWIWRESEHYRKGKEIAELGLQRKVFRRSEGALVTDLAKYGLTDTVVAKSDGTALYLTQDIALVQFKKKKFPADLYVWLVGAEQTLYFKQLFAVCEQLGIGKGKEFLHLAFALVNFKGGGKMSTRSGDVVTADEVLDLVHGRAEKLIKGTNKALRGELSEKRLEELAEQVAIAAVKYSLLRYGRETTINFDIDESLSLTGNSGPYLQYTYARAKSVLRKGDIEAGAFRHSELDSESIKILDRSRIGSGMTVEEQILLRMICRFPEVVGAATESYAPNLIANYLFELAQQFNLFYDKQSILGATGAGQKEFRLLLTVGTAQIIKNGLTLFGIETPERM